MCKNRSYSILTTTTRALYVIVMLIRNMLTTIDRRRIYPDELASHERARNNSRSSSHLPINLSAILALPCTRLSNPAPSVLCLPRKRKPPKLSLYSFLLPPFPLLPLTVHLKDGTAVHLEEREEKKSANDLTTPKTIFPPTTFGEEKRKEKLTM